jgi:hypothetical protein
VLKGDRDKRRGIRNKEHKYVLDTTKDVFWNMVERFKVLTI